MEGTDLYYVVTADVPGAFNPTSLRFDYVGEALTQASALSREVLQMSRLAMSLETISKDWSWRAAVKAEPSMPI
jgi:hypothetical protein